MSLVSCSSTTSSMSIESMSNSLKMEIEEMLVATQGIIQSLDTAEKCFTNLQKSIVLQQPAQPTYMILSPSDSKTNLYDALDILQSTSDASTFATNMLNFLQNAKDIIIG